MPEYYSVAEALRHLPFPISERNLRALLRERGIGYAKGRYVFVSGEQLTALIETMRLPSPSSHAASKHSRSGSRRRRRAHSALESALKMLED